MVQDSTTNTITGFGSKKNDKQMRKKKQSFQEKEPSKVSFLNCRLVNRKIHDAHTWAHMNTYSCTMTDCIRKGCSSHFQYFMRILPLCCVCKKHVVPLCSAFFPPKIWYFSLCSIPENSYGIIQYGQKSTKTVKRKWSEKLWGSLEKDWADGRCCCSPAVLHSLWLQR